MVLPAFVYSLEFWKAVSFIIAALVAQFTDYKLEAAVVLGFILSLFSLFGVKPELLARGYKVKGFLGLGKK